ncbi:hypothetical protein AB8E98_05530 [Salmonella enterica]
MNDSRMVKSSFIVSLAGVFVAICALGLSIYQGHLQKINYEISVQPYITIVPTVDGAKNEYGYYIYNAGAGRGYIEKIQYYINGKLIDSDNLSSLVKIVHYFGLNEKCFAYGNPRKGDAVSLDEMTTLLTISAGAYNLPECAQTIQDFHMYINKAPSDISIKIWYKSLYNITFVYNLEDNSQNKL